MTEVLLDGLQIQGQLTAVALLGAEVADVLDPFLILNVDLHPHLLHYLHQRRYYRLLYVFLLFPFLTLFILFFLLFLFHVFVILFLFLLFFFLLFLHLCFFRL